MACANIGTPPKAKISHQTMKWGGLLKHRGGPSAGGADGGFMYWSKYYGIMGDDFFLFRHQLHDVFTRIRPFPFKVTLRATI